MYKIVLEIEDTFAFALLFAIFISESLVSLRFMVFAIEVLDPVALFVARGPRMSVVWFTSGRYSHASAATQRALTNLGFEIPTSTKIHRTEQLIR